MKDEFLKVVHYLAEHGELFKAYLYLKNPPAILDEDKDILDYSGKVQIQLDKMKQFQDKGSVDGQFNTSFITPPDVTKLVAFQHLRKRLIELKLNNLVDVGCYSGWMGRELSLVGIKAHGIDVHPVVLQIAAFVSSGTLATFEYLPVGKLGHHYPKHFGGAIVFDVLEHTFDPELAVRNINMAVKDGGWVFLNLPHPDGEASVNIENLDLHEHLHCFSEKEIKRLMPNAKIEIINNEGNAVNWFVEYQV